MFECWLVCVRVQVAEENGLEVLDKLDATPVSQKTPGQGEASGLQTLTTEEEDTLSSRYVLRRVFR